MSETAVTRTTIAERPAGRRGRRRLALLLLALLVLWLGYTGWRVARLAASLQSRQPEIQSLLDGGLANVNADRAETLVLATRADVAALNAHLRPIVWAAPLFGWLPRYGPFLAEAPNLLEMADAGSAAAAHAVQGLKPGLVALQQPSDGRSRLPALVAAVDGARPQLIQAAAELDRAVSARQRIERPQALPWRVRTLLEQVDPLLPAAQSALHLAPLLPEIMGQNGRRTYIILAQNEDELRPTGGFISGVGLLTVENGAIVALDFEDANVVDDFLNKPYGFPPQPLYDIMGLELFLFRDANFWPDFPTSAESAMNLYTYGRGLPLDGAIAIDQTFLQLLVGVVGPVNVAGLGQRVTGDNIITILRSAWSIQEEETVADWFNSRKAFMGPLAGAIRDRLENDPAALDLRCLLVMLHQAAAGKHLQIYMRDPAVAAALATAGWDGRVRNVPGHDILMVVDTSVGFNKSRAVVESSLDYRVALDDQGNGQAIATVTYTHRGLSQSQACQHTIPYHGGIQYDTLVNACFYNYLRLYAPAGSRLLDASRHTAPAEAMVRGLLWDRPAQTVADPSGLTVFDNFLLVPAGESRTSSFTYQLPAGVSQPDGPNRLYSLLVYKQAGAPTQPLVVTVALPAGASLVHANPAPAAADGRELTFVVDLTADWRLELIYR